MLPNLEFDGSAARAIRRKNRSGIENTIREFKLSHNGITVGPPMKGLVDFQRYPGTKGRAL